jgi:lysozyme
MNEALNLAILLIKRFEGCRLTSYKDIVGVWTIGYGETLGVTEGITWTQEQAEWVLKQRIGYFLLLTLKNCPQLHLEPSERIAACVSLAYNIGIGAFRASSVSRYTIRREYVNGGKSFLLWNKAGGRIIAGLTRRRELEKIKYDSN